MKNFRFSYAVLIIAIVGLWGMFIFTGCSQENDGITSIDPVAAPIDPVDTGEKDGVHLTKFDYGWCTWFVAVMWDRLNHPVTWRGDANRWIQNAEAQRYIAVPWPNVNYICAQNNLSSRGHVSLVIEKDPPNALWPNRIRVREMNNPVFGQESYLATDRPGNLGRWIYKNSNNSYGTGNARVSGFISADRR